VSTSENPRAVLRCRASRRGQQIGVTFAALICAIGLVVPGSSLMTRWYQTWPVAPLFPMRA
jgi:hypothetical protein